LKTRINYSNILIISFAGAYFIIAILNPFGFIPNKVVLLCSAVSLIVAVSQILDSIAICMELMEKKVLQKSLQILIQIRKQNVADDSITMQNKIFSFREDKNKIHEQYAKKINHITKWSNGLLTTALILFIIGMAINIEIDCGVISDTASLISFSLIFLSIFLNDYLNTKINNFDSEMQRELNKMEV